MQVVLAPSGVKQWWSRVGGDRAARREETQRAEQLQRELAEADRPRKYTLDDLLAGEEIPLPVPATGARVAGWTDGRRRDALLAAFLSILVIGAAIGSTFEPSGRGGASRQSAYQGGSSQGGAAGPSGSPGSSIPSLSSPGSLPAPGAPQAATGGTGAADPSPGSGGSAGPGPGQGPGGTLAAPPPAQASTPAVPQGPSPAAPAPPPASPPAVPAPTTMPAWLSANGNTVSEIATDLEQLQADVNTAVATQDFSGLADDCTLFNSDVTGAQGSLPVPDPTFQSIWSSVLGGAPGLVSTCDSAVWNRDVSVAQAVGNQVNAALAQMVPLGRQLPCPLQPPTPFAGTSCANPAGLANVAARPAARSASPTSPTPPRAG